MRGQLWGHQPFPFESTFKFINNLRVKLSSPRHQIFAQQNVGAPSLSGDFRRYVDSIDPLHVTFHATIDADKKREFSRLPYEPNQ